MPRRPSFERNVRQLLGDVTFAQMHRPPTVPPRQHLANTLSSLTEQQIQFITTPQVSDTIPLSTTKRDVWFLPVCWQETQYGLLQMFLKSPIWQFPQVIAAQLAECCAKLLQWDEQHPQIVTSPMVIPNLGERYATLTQREREILRFFAAGTTNHAIAQATGIAETTVKSHRHRIYDKLGIHNSREAMTVAQLAEML